ncbi:MAG: sulfotransferase [Gammaproteobacteria bacterium]|nr:sulfotransferase [Gammaproteobacteria bacterium]
MAADIAQLTLAARQAVAAKEWPRVSSLAMEIVRRAPADPEAPFLMGLAEKAARRSEGAAKLFQQALSKDSERYDAAVELANQYLALNRYGEAKELLDRYRDKLQNSPLYLDMAGQAYFLMGHYEQAWPLYEQANRLQPDVEMFQAHLASCAVYLGKIDVAKSIYRKFLKRHPRHQQFHYEYSQLDRARDDRHIKQMLKVLKKSDPKPANNIYLFYALGKEYEDLGRWADSFRYYKKGGEAVKTVASYSVADDVEIMDKIIETCTAAWLQDKPATRKTAKTPIFVVGLPRTGTTLTDRILSSHSLVQSAGESQLLQMVLRDGSRAGNQIGITSAQIEAAAQRDPEAIAKAYVDAVSHRLGDEPYFVEKLPENVLYLGFAAKAWPNARIVHLRRHPMDACFAVYKQSFFRFAYSLDDLARYYLAYDRLSRHWRTVLDSRMVELNYEDLVSDQEAETRRLLEELGLNFEEACLRFDQNVAPVATASSVQVREKVHTRSVGKWKKFERQLRPLREQLEQGGVAL